MAKARQALNPVEMSKHAVTKVTTMGNITQLTVFDKSPSSGCVCRKISKDLYEDTRTGEVKEYQHIENRAENMQGIRRTQERIRGLINTNITDPKNCLWLTFTYAENMTDVKVLYLDFKNFWKRFCYWCDRNKIVRPEYITVQEPQGRGAWHIHAFFTWDSKAPFIPNDIIASLWGHGFTKTKALQDCDNVGAYFSAYLGDMPLDEVQQLDIDDQEKACIINTVEEKEFTDDQGHIKKKKFVKGGRLFLYPPGMNIVRTSRGVKQPEIEYMSRESAEKKVCSAKQTFSRTYEIVNDNGEVVNTISKTYYNSKRK